MTFALTYATGTISVANGSTAVTGSGVTWTTIREGDSLIDPATGARGIIASIEDTSGALTLLDPWPGTSLTDDAYRIVYDSPARRSGVVVSAAIEQLVAAQTILLARRADYLVQDALLDTPPGSPTAGDVYLIGSSPSGAWSGKAGYLATWTDAADWAFTAPEVGMRVIDLSADPPTFYTRGSSWEPSGAAWSDLTGVPAAIDAIDGLTPAADRLPYYTGSSSADLAVLTSAGRALLDDADAAAQRDTLGLAQLATKATIDSDALVADGILTFAKLASAAIASQVQAEAGTATDALMTPQRAAQAIVAKSPATLAATWVAQQPSGLLCKGGKVAAGASSGTVSFAAAFPTACVGAWLQPIGAGATAAYTAHLNGEPTASSFDWYLRKTAAAGTTGASTAFGFFWIAWGY